MTKNLSEEVGNINHIHLFLWKKLGFIDSLWTCKYSIYSIIHVIFEMRIRQNRENDMADWVRGEGIRRKR